MGKKHASLTVDRERGMMGLKRRGEIVLTEHHVVCSVVHRLERQAPPSNSLCGHTAIYVVTTESFCKQHVGLCNPHAM